MLNAVGTAQNIGGGIQVKLSSGQVIKFYQMIKGKMLSIDIAIKV